MPAVEVFAGKKYEALIRKFENEVTDAFGKELEAAVGAQERVLQLQVECPVGKPAYDHYFVAACQDGQTAIGMGFFAIRIGKLCRETGLRYFLKADFVEFLFNRKLLATAEEIKKNLAFRKVFGEHIFQLAIYGKYFSGTARDTDRCRDSIK